MRLRNLGLTEIILGGLVIENAERALGRLSDGQKVDLLLDNLPALEGSEHAMELLGLVKEELARKPGQPMVVHGSKVRKAGR